MIRKTFIFTFIVLLGFSLWFTSSHANNGEPNNAAPDDFQRVPNFIFGSNDIEYMENLPKDSEDYILGRKVACLIIDKGPGKDPGCCTGFLISPNLLLTNDHCIRYDPDEDDSDLVPAHHISVRMDFYKGKWYDNEPTTGVERILRTDPEKDYALLKLSWPIGWEYGWLGLDGSSGDASQSVKIIHHSNCERKQISRRNSQIVDPSDFSVKRDPWILAYLADTLGGSSGAPVFLRDRNTVIAINHSGYSKNNPRFNQGTLMSAIWPEISGWHPKTIYFDLFVEAPRVSKTTLRAGEQFTFSVHIGNRSPLISRETTLRFYRGRGNNPYQSIGTRDLGPMLPGGAGGRILKTMTAPTAPGTYRYMACIDKDPYDGKHDNNCSDAVEITVLPRPFSNLIYWTDQGKIQRGGTDGIAQDVVTGLSYPQSIALDAAGGRMYWKERGKIQRATLDGTDVEDIVTGLGRPDIALDVAGGKLYWADGDKIQRANLDGSAVEDLITELNNAESIALDVVNRKIYWMELRGPHGLNPPDNGHIRRANFDGTNVENVLTGLDTSGSSIALDAAGGKMYWVGVAGQFYEFPKIQRANLNGTNIQNIVTKVYAEDITLDVVNRKIYWIEGGIPGDGRIRRANFDGSQVEDLFINLTRPNGIAFGIRQFTFLPNSIANQTFTVGTPVDLKLPYATGGVEDYVYTMSPLPAGLLLKTPDSLLLEGHEFQVTPKNPRLIGTPKTPQNATPVTYTATDATGETISLIFTITVKATPGTGITFTPSVIADQTFTVGSAVSLRLPNALPPAGGTRPYSYTLTPPTLPAGKPLL